MVIEVFNKRRQKMERFLKSVEKAIRYTLACVVVSAEILATALMITALYAFVAVLFITSTLGSALDRDVSKAGDDIEKDMFFHAFGWAYRLTGRDDLLNELMKL